MTPTDFFLGMIFLAILFGTLFLSSIFTSIHSALCRQNIYIIELRQAIMGTFDDDSDGS